MARIECLDNDDLDVTARWCDGDDEADFEIVVGDFSVAMSMVEVKELRKVIEQKLPRNMSFKE